MKTAFLAGLSLILAGVSRVSAQATPTPLATPDDVPVSHAQQASSSPPPAICPECGTSAYPEMGKEATTAKPPEDARAILTKLEQEWGDAIVKTDVPALQRIVADEYTSTGPDGGILNKADHVASAKALAGKIASFKFSGINVRVYGDMAVITGDGMIRWVSDAIDGADAGVGFRWMDVFVKRDGRWQAVASQATNIDSSTAKR